MDVATVDVARNLETSISIQNKVFEALHGPKLTNDELQSLKPIKELASEQLDKALPYTKHMPPYDDTLEKQAFLVTSESSDEALFLEIRKDEKEGTNLFLRILHKDEEHPYHRRNSRIFLGVHIENEGESLKLITDRRDITYYQEVCAEEGVDLRAIYSKAKEVSVSNPGLATQLEEIYRPEFREIRQKDTEDLNILMKVLTQGNVSGDEYTVIKNLNNGLPLS